MKATKYFLLYGIIHLTMPRKFLEYHAPLCLALLLLISGSGCGPGYDEGRTWSVYKADRASSSHSPLQQINAENVKALKHAWTFEPNDARAGSRSGNAECNPIIIDRKSTRLNSSHGYISYA